MSGHRPAKNSSSTHQEVTSPRPSPSGVKSTARGWTLSELFEHCTQARTHARNCLYWELSLRRTAARGATLEPRDVLGSAEGRPRAASWPQWALGPQLPALSGSSAGTRGEHLRPPRSPRWGAASAARGMLGPPTTPPPPRPREPGAPGSSRALGGVRATPPSPSPFHKPRQTGALHRAGAAKASR